MDQLQTKFEQAISDNKDIFLAHMEGKYDVHFLPISYMSGGTVVPEEFRCHAEGTDRERDYVRVFREEENGEEVFHDDYFGIIIRDAYQSRVQKICEETVGAAKGYVYRYSVSFFDDPLTAENTIDDAIAMGQKINASKYVFFEVTPGSEADFEEACDRICEKLTAARLPGTVKFIGLAQGELSNITQDGYLDDIPSMVKADGRVCLMMTSRMVTVQQGGALDGGAE